VKLKRLCIDCSNDNKGYKNLKNSFELNFENSDGITLLIGNNGSGKSNVLEAISLIFQWLYKGYNEPMNKFEYKLEYTIDNNEIEIFSIPHLSFPFSLPARFGGLTIKVNNEVQNLEYLKTHELLPDKVFAIYSGEELRLWDMCYFSNYEEYYKGVIDNTFGIDSLKMNYINKYSWTIGLIALYLKDNAKAKNIINNLNISNIIFDINIDKLNDFHTNRQNEVTIFVNAIKDKLDESNKISFDDFVGLEYDEVSITEVYSEVYYKLLVAILPKDENYKLINKIDIEFDSSDINLSKLSEGQKKEILVTFVSEVLATENSILLLDEPDSHIHIANKQRLKNILIQSEFKNIILTTHSPTLAHVFDENSIIMLDNNGTITPSNKTKAINEVMGSMWTYQEKNIFLSSNKDIILVEGKTDIEYIKTALEKLQSSGEYQNLEFEYLPFNGTDGLTSLVDKYTPKENQKIIALLDRDQAGKKTLKTILNIDTINNDFLYEKKDSIYISLIPKKNRFRGENFLIEDYFSISKIKNIMFEYKNGGYLDIRKSDNKIKNRLIEKCKEFNVDDFKNFKKLFDMIQEIKNLDTPTQSEAQ
jgi:ABC-type cobalamin/Fe3+-siderophores transport system ATPase subunit